MFCFEHGMLGMSLAIASGATRRHGVGLAVMATLAGMAPDLDAAALLFGVEAYARIHRTWGHNLLIACGGGMFLGIVGYGASLSLGVRHRALRLWQSLGEAPSVVPSVPTPSHISLCVWALIGMMAGLAHLVTDILYPWPIPFGWPFADHRTCYPIFVWHERVPLVIFVVEMFAIFQWRTHAKLIAWLTLMVFTTYVGVSLALGKMT